MRIKKLAPLLVGPLLLSAAACAEPLPSVQLVIGPRVLAIKTEVTTPLPFIEEEADAATRSQAMPFEGVTITPFLVGPQGPYAADELSPAWIACEMSPGQGLFGCIQDSFPIELDAIPACPVVNLETIELEDPPPTVSPCLISREFAPEFTVPFSQNLFVGGDIELMMIAGPPSGTSTEDCAEPILAGESQLPNDCLYAVQRLSLGPVEAMIALLAEFGVEIDGLDPIDPEDIPDADRNPRITKIESVITNPKGETGTTNEVNSGDTISVRLGDTLRIITTSPEGDLQTFPIEVNNGESFQEDQERYFGAWFVTWGELLSGYSDDPESFNDLTLIAGEQDEDETPPNDEGHIFYVLTDNRQGVAFWHLRLEVLPEE